MARIARCIVLAVIVTIGCGQPKLSGTDLGATAAPDFTLTDGLSGKSVQLSAHRGQVVALTFLYTNCPDSCPLTAARFKAAQDQLAQDVDIVTFIAVSIDPDFDTPQTAQRFSSDHGLARNWFYLVGGRAQLAGTNSSALGRARVRSARRSTRARARELEGRARAVRAASRPPGLLDLGETSALIAAEVPRCGT